MLYYLCEIGNELCYYIIEIVENNPKNTLNDSSNKSAGLIGTKSKLGGECTQYSMTSFKDEYNNIDYDLVQFKYYS